MTADTIETLMKHHDQVYTDIVSYMYTGKIAGSFFKSTEDLESYLLSNYQLIAKRPVLIARLHHEEHMQKSVRNTSTGKMYDSTKAAGITLQQVDGDIWTFPSLAKGCEFRVHKTKKRRSHVTAKDGHYYVIKETDEIFYTIAELAETLKERFNDPHCFGTIYRKIKKAIADNATLNFDRTTYNIIKYK